MATYDTLCDLVQSLLDKSHVWIRVFVSGSRSKLVATQVIRIFTPARLYA
jgi:hypothetical protein